jgi:hypothetical protein
MSKYQILLSVLDGLASEARAAGYTSHFPEGSDVADLNKSRSRAYLHLFLKVRFGILEPQERESYITEGSQDGGIDGYFIDAEHKRVYFVQSKFRVTEANFQSKKIELEEIAAMDTDRVLDGERLDGQGNPYNGKIQELIRAIREIRDIGRYEYRVVIIANVRDKQEGAIKKLVGAYDIEVIDFSRCYTTLVFPVISGAYFNQENLLIYLDLSNKSAGTKISYDVVTESGICSITALFVPTIEIARMMFQYRNAILRFNPRSYLEHDGAKVNHAIRRTMLSGPNNEFALFNNGITMISDETAINEKIGHKGRAQLSIRNPQIINGGQTAFTLSRIYEEQRSNLANVFDNKEVLLKVITINEQSSPSTEDKQQLIDRISTATNQQTPVSDADRRSGQPAFVDLQVAVFDRYGLLFERKRGEFQDGLKDKYLDDVQIIERNLFLRIYCASNGSLLNAHQKAIFAHFKNPERLCEDTSGLDRAYFGYFCFQALKVRQSQTEAAAETPTDQGREAFCRLFALSLSRFPETVPLIQSQAEQLAGELVEQSHGQWIAFVDSIAKSEKTYVDYVRDRKTDEIVGVFSRSKWLRSSRIEKDIRMHFTAQSGIAG